MTMWGSELKPFNLLGRPPPWRYDDDDDDGDGEDLTTNSPTSRLTEAMEGDEQIYKFNNFDGVVSSVLICL